MAYKELFTVNDPKSPLSEAFKTLRTNIQFSSPDFQVKAVLITSAGPGEGKSTVASNLAVTTAQCGKKTLIMDCDMRKPRVHKVFELSNEVGLSNILIGEATIEDTIIETEIPNLYVLPTGIKPPNPSETAASSKMQHLIEALKDKFDFIIVDTPPVNMVTDAQILSRYVDGCIIVVAAGEANREGVQRAAELLQRVNAKILGTILNKVDMSSKSYYGYYYKYGYDSSGNRTRKKKIYKNKTKLPM